MVSTSDMHTLIQYEATKIADELYELVILVHVPVRFFSSVHYKITSLGAVQEHKLFFYNTSKEIQTNQTGVTHKSTYVISTM